jgi:hypothetical protein
MKVLGVQQNLWGAMETLSRFVRAAGTGMKGCVNDTDPPPTGTAPPATGLRAFTAGPPAAVVRLAPIWIRNGAAGAPDSITVVFGSGSFGTFSDAALGGTVDEGIEPVVTAPGMTAAFRANEFAVLLDTSGLAAGPPLGDRGCTLFQITGIDAATHSLQRAATSPFNPSGAAPGLVPFSYAGGASPKAGIRAFGTLSWVQFAVDSSGAVPRLTMARLDGQAGPTAPVVLAEGIEDLQIAYACDLLPAPPDAGDGVFSEGTDGASRAGDEWIGNAAGDVPPPACVRPQAVRLTIVARSTEPDDNLANVAANAKPAVEDGAAGGRDRFRHRVLTTVVYVRNR